MSEGTTKDPEELLEVKQVAEEFGMGESTVWLLIKRHDVPRYRVPARPRKTLVRRGDVERALYTPIRRDDKGKAAA